MVGVVVLWAFDGTQLGSWEYKEQVLGDCEPPLSVSAVVQDTTIHTPI